MGRGTPIIKLVQHSLGYQMTHTQIFANILMGAAFAFIVIEASKAAFVAFCDWRDARERRRWISELTKEGDK